MTTTTLEIAPYAPPQNVLEVLHYVRKRKLPEVLDNKTLMSIGIPQGNVSRTLATFRFLQLVDEDGRSEDTFDRIARATDEQYPEQLAQVMREGYKTIFTYWEPAEDDEIKLDNLFRQHYDPQAQGRRMVTLFQALCREAGIIEGTGAEARPRAKRVTTPKDQASKRSRNTRPAQATEVEQAPLFHTAPTSSSASAADTSAIDTYYALCLETMKRLPTNHRWTPKQRAKWLQAIAANVDLLVEVDEEEDAPTREVTIIEADQPAAYRG